MHQITQTIILLICFPLLACNSAAHFTSQEQEIPNKEIEKNTNTNQTIMNNYQDKDLVIQLEHTPGGPCSDCQSYKLSIYGNGSYTYNEMGTHVSNDTGSITKTSVQEILKNAESMHFKKMIINRPPPKFIADGRNIIVSIWSNYSITKGVFNSYDVPESVQNLVDLILKKVDKPKQKHLEQIVPTIHTP